MIELDTIYNEDCLTGLRRMEAGTVDCCVTSPPYYALRDYANALQRIREQEPVLI